MTETVLITGNNGYIGPVMTSMAQALGYKVVGLDSNYFNGCNFLPSDDRLPFKHILKDIREVKKEDLDGVTAIIHLAGLSNDALGEINPSITEDINTSASVKLAKIAKEAGIQRFIFASSCSLYGIASGDESLTEDGKFNPITAYAKAKVQVEEEVAKLADDNFHPVFMRNATVYGVSPNLRLDLVVNNLIAHAYLTGKASIMSDGSPWRPIVHVEDFCNAFLAALQAPIDQIHNEAFNVGINEENYQVKDIAAEVEKVVPDCKIEILNNLGSDERSYRVDFSKIKNTLEHFKPVWNLKKGINEIYQAYKNFNLTMEDFESPKYFRIRWINHLIKNNKLDTDIRWK